MLFLTFVLKSFWYQQYSLLPRSTLCSAALRRCFITFNNYTYTAHTHAHARTHHHLILSVWTNDWSYCKSRVMKLALTKTWTFYWLQWIIGHCSCVWALWIRLYLKTVLLLSSVRGVNCAQNFVPRDRCVASDVSYLKGKPSRHSDW